jgi:hypothetical protein
LAPPEEILTVPSNIKSSKPWTVVAKNRKVNREWEELISRFPENANRCYQDLCNEPMKRQPGRVFPLKGKKYKGA